jgi:ATP-dependent helicase/nuclease subunit A
MSFTWSAEKQDLFRFGSDILVSASAGTGKTTALVELFIRLLDGQTDYPLPVEPENILAITFTNKAAREMRERIAQASIERLKTRRFDDVLQNANIKTFHGFCSGLLKDYAFEAGLAPDFELLDEFDAALLLERCVIATIQDALSNRDEDIMRLLKTKRVQHVADALIRVLSVSYGPDLKEPDISTEHARLDSDLRRVYANYGELLNKLARSDLKTDAALRGIALWRQHWDGLIANRRLPDSSMDIKEGFAIFEEWNAIQSQWKSFPRKNVSTLRSDFVSLLKHAMAMFNHMMALPDAAAVVRLAKRAFNRFSESKLAAFQLDFEDLQRHAISLIEKNAALRDELQRRYHVILVDEFQDTNATQVKLLALIQRDDSAAKRMGLPPARRLLVGDRKQSIYRFRGADVSVFRAMERELLAGKTGSRRLHFSENFRSNAQLLDFFNGFFSKVMFDDSAADYAVGYDESDNLVSGNIEAPTSQAPDTPPLPFEIFRIDKKELSAPEARRLEARALATRISEMICSGNGPDIVQKDGTIRKPRFGDVCILVRRMTHGKHYEHALSQAGIPLIVTQSSGLLNRREISDLIALLRFLAHPSDVVARLAVLRSPACLISDNLIIALMQLPLASWQESGFVLDNWSKILKEIKASAHEKERLLNLVDTISDLRTRQRLMPVTEILEQLTGRLDLILVSDQGDESKRARANIEKVMDLVRHWERRYPGFDVSRCLERLRSMEKKEKREPEGAPPHDEQAVQMMTIHQAKGLEFPIVIIPDLAARPNPKRGDIFVTESREVGVKLFVDHSQTSLDTLVSTRGAEAEKAKEGAEYQRLLYVALTRARDYLVLSGDITTARKEKSEVQPTWMDWISDYVENHGQGVRILNIVSENTSLFNADSINIIKLAKTSLDLPPVDAVLPAFYIPEVVGTFSISMLNELQRCERAYYLRQLLDRSTLLWVEEEPESLPELGNNPSELNTGIWVHRYLEVRQLTETTGSEGWTRFLEARGIDVNTAWAASVGNLIQKTGDFPYPTITARWRELPFLARISLPGGRAIRLKGKVDAVGEYPDGRLVLIDYKYASSESGHLDRYMFQLRAYAAVLAAATGIDFNHMSAWLAFMKDEAPWREVSLSVHDMNKFSSNLDTLIERTVDIGKNDVPSGLWNSLDRCEPGECRFEKFCKQR